jgi:uncharacterized protein (TIGR00730 family)
MSDSSTNFVPPVSDTVPPVPTPSNPNTDKQHHVMGQVLTRVIEEGKESVPAVQAPLVCKPRQLESWRVFKIMSEFVEGFEIIKKYGLAASIFGSARCGFEDHFYKDATALAGKLAKGGYAVITGGSAGIMEAANKGAFEAGGASIGLNIMLEHEQGQNKFLTESLTFNHFFVRKVMLTFASEVYIFFPGGYGTLDEFFEIATLVQTKKIQKVPIVLYGREYWEPLEEFFKTKLLAEHAAIDPSDLELYYIADSVDDAYDYISKNVRC